MHKIVKKSTDHDHSSNQGPAYQTPVSLTTAPLLSQLITSLNFYLINENSSLISKTDLPIENLDCSTTFCMRLLDDFSENKNVHSIGALAPFYCCNTLRLTVVAISSNRSHFRIDQWYICSIT